MLVGSTRVIVFSSVRYSDLTSSDFQIPFSRFVILSQTWQFLSVKNGTNSSLRNSVYHNFNPAAAGNVLCYQILHQYNKWALFLPFSLFKSAEIDHQPYYLTRPNLNFSTVCHFRNCSHLSHFSLKPDRPRKVFYRCVVTLHSILIPLELLIIMLF